MTGSLRLPDGALRTYSPNPAEGDLGWMYVLDVLGVAVLVRERDGDVYVHIDSTDTDSARPADKPVAYEINNAGAETLG